ncbi:hypothetical protein L2E82_48018 [Cichorium intybus]|uniref:Uncharacterized protein n=1 Tax=Cichorium intybus TaxID=13427 RepID=A0ACB8YXB8_CICIN|nr:hypothetical protein L2E82_48018 [Cichorium intybus]
MLSGDTKGHDADGGGWTKVSRRVHRQDKSITSFYVSNIQQNTSVEMLRRAFQSFGKIADIYIPGRKDRGGSYFAFVKYFGVTDAEEMERTLNRVKCGSCITRVNIAKYEKNGVNGVAQVRGTSRPQVKSVPNHLWKTKDGRSFAEVVGGNMSGTRPTITLRKVPAMDCDGSSLIGEVLSLQHLKDIPKLLHADGRIPCQLYFVGGLKAVLKFCSPQAADRYLKSEHEWNRWFKWIKLGISDEVKFDRMAWVRLHGFPIHLRSMENVASVVGSIGEVLEVEGNNWATSDLTATTARILTSSKLMINEIVSCVYDRKMYNIGVVECAEAWDPISSYYEGSETNSVNGDNENMDLNNDEDQEDSYGDVNSEAWRDDVEEGEIVAESNEIGVTGGVLPTTDREIGAPGGVPPTTDRESLEKEKCNNFTFNVGGETLYGEKNTNNSSRHTMGTNIEGGGEIPGCYLDTNIPDPSKVPLPDSPNQPIEPNKNLGDPFMELNNPGPPKFTATVLNENSRCNLGNSSKRRKLNKISRPTASVSMNPRNLVGDFDLNVTVSNQSASSTRKDCSSSASIKVDRVIEIGNRVGFQIDNSSLDIVDEVLCKLPSGVGVKDGPK